MEVKRLTPLHYRIYDKLKQHEGEQNAIHASELATAFNITTRELRLHIHAIREAGELEKVIGATDAGYFIATIDDFAKAIRRLMNHSISGLKAARAMKRKAALHGQGKIKLGPYFKDFAETLAEIDE